MQEDPGWVYVLTNPSMPGLVKVGKTERDPDDRMAELSSATGVPTPFELAYKAFFPSCSAAEDAVHAALGGRGYRVSTSREFFKIALAEAIEVVVQNQLQNAPVRPGSMTFPGGGPSQASIGPTTTTTFAPWDKENAPWVDLVDKGFDCEFGLGEELEDENRALDYYGTAAKMGSSYAYLRMGEIFSKGYGALKDTKKALELFDRSGGLGDPRGFAGRVRLPGVDGLIEAWREKRRLGA